MIRALDINVRAVLAALVWLMLSPLAAGQKHNPRAKAEAPAATPNKLLSIKVSGTTRYTEKEILGASGLQIGQEAADGDFKEAAQRLGQSGLFSGVVYSFSYSNAGAKVEFQLTDNDKLKLLPARFENFVWFTDAELYKELERRVPLFKDSLLPDSGRLTDRVNEALQAMLTERQLPGRVDYLRESKPEAGEMTAIAFRVEEVTISIRKVEFPGASPEQVASLERAARQLEDAEYFRSKLAAVAKFDLLPLYLQRGYLKAEFGLAGAKVVSGPGAQPDTAKTSPGENTTSPEVEVVAILPVKPGKVYTVSGVTWKGNSAVTTDEASRLFHLTVDHPADAVRLDTDTESLIRLYRSRGYMTATVKPEAQIDDDKGTVHYDMNVAEGDLYRMGELEIAGVDSESRDRLNNAWKLREGQPYNADYTRKFLEDVAHLLPRGLQFSLKINEQLNKQEKLVDVTIQFKVQ
jgi:outer membrane protein assembly factor BamA